ncbi:aminoacetone oxidase family FAD-binding enzyme [Candidatus Uhrbacteria bacterium]|jgi:predicted Rossmann fold flavoprotein|nr:aminoacetone oxidase family FAD-binding enzyme [Candidatus Uhrbacteria bacterium]
MKEEEYDVIVIGGGPAGMMAAGRAGELGAKVVLIEKNERLGKKLSITGGRRCNITNAEPDDKIFLANFPESKQFLFSPFSKFNVESTFEFFEGRGLPLMVEDRKRAFPKSENAEDVCGVLEDYVAESGNVTVVLDTAVKSFVVESEKLRGVRTSVGTFKATKIILATGGMAAPETGSTGEGLSMLANIGHTVKDPDPNLAPLRTSSKWVHKLSGTTVNDMTLRFTQSGKSQHKVRGRLLFTHFGISGPIVINSAHKVKELLKGGPLTASVDLFPDYDIGSLNTFFIELFETNKKKLLKTVLKDLLQKRLSEAILKFPGLNIGDTPAHAITKDQRKLLVHALKDMDFPITGTMGFEWSIVADGGADLSEVDFKSMTSRIYPNLYLVGDTLDINRPSGGFSLQLCWTTGWIAGSHAASQS